MWQGGPKVKIRVVGDLIGNDPLDLGVTFTSFFIGVSLLSFFHTPYTHHTPTFHAHKRICRQKIMLRHTRTPARTHTTQKYTYMASYSSEVVVSRGCVVIPTAEGVCCVIRACVSECVCCSVCCSVCCRACCNVCCSVWCVRACLEANGPLLPFPSPRSAAITNG